MAYSKHTHTHTQNDRNLDKFLNTRHTSHPPNLQTKMSQSRYGFLREIWQLHVYTKQTYLIFLWNVTFIAVTTKVHILVKKHILILSSLPSPLPPSAHACLAISEPIICHSCRPVHSLGIPSLWFCPCLWMGPSSGHIRLLHCCY